MASNTRRSKRFGPSTTAGDFKNSLIYEPYEPRLGSSSRGDVFTCHEINSDDWRKGLWEERVPTCGSCGFLRDDKPFKKSLQGEDYAQQEGPRRYECQTLRRNKQVLLCSRRSRKKQRKKPPPAAAVMSPIIPEVPIIVKSLPFPLGVSSSTTIEEEPFSVVRKSILTVKEYESEFQVLRQTIFDLKKTIVDLQEDKRTQAVSIVTLQKTNTTLRLSITALGKDLSACRKENEILERKIDSLTVTGDFESDLERLLADTFNSHLFMAQGTHQKTKNRAIVEVLWNKLMKDKFRPFVVQRAREAILPRSPLLNACEVAKLMDVSGSVINLKAVHLLRQMETDGDCAPEKSSDWITSTYKVKDAMYHLEEKGQGIIPFKTTDESGFDGAVFDYKKMFLFLVRYYKLEEAALDPSTGPVQWCFTLDGADISTNYTHVTAGMKTVDPRAIDPHTGLPIGLHGATRLQSRELCHVFKILLAKDTKALYDDHFKDFFDFFKDVQDNGIAHFPAGSFEILSPQDMSSHWKCLKRGGGCKSKIDFCHCCACISEDSYAPRHRICPSCKSLGSTDCYHWEVGDRETLVRLQDDFSVTIKDFPFLAGDPNVTIYKLKCHLDMTQIDKAKDPSNIDYEPVTPSDVSNFSRVYINHDLKVLGLSLLGNLEVRRARVRHSVEVLYNLREMSKQIVAGEYAGAFILIDQAIPCVLHCENRSDEKMLKMIIIEGYNDRDTQVAKDRFLSELVVVVNNQIIGSNNRPACWRIITAIDKEGKKVIGDQSMPNTIARKLLDSFDAIAGVCIEDETRRLRWEHVAMLWSTVIEKARQREDFSDDDINDFTKKSDAFFAEWVDMHGRDGMSNYFHQIGSGHFTYYLRKYRNLFRYSQQGWESLNATIKALFFKWTQRGGHGGKNSEATSKIKPIARWVQRRLLWISGDYKQYFNSDGRPIKS